MAREVEFEIGPDSVNPQLPEVFGVKFSSKDFRRIFSIKLHNFKLWKMPKL